jgi:hypothetical protein
MLTDINSDQLTFRDRLRYATFSNKLRDHMYSPVIVSHGKRLSSAIYSFCRILERYLHQLGSSFLLCILGETGLTMG